MSHCHDDELCLLPDKECDALLYESSEINECIQCEQVECVCLTDNASDNILNDTIMLLDTQLSAVKLRLTGMTPEHHEYDVLTMLKQRLTQDVMWYKGLKIGISEGYI